MSWSVSWSWQSPSRISAVESVNGHLCVAYGLELVLFNDANEIQWQRSMPFKVHAICNADGRIGVLAAHAFYLLNTVDGSLVHEGRSSPGGFLQLLNRPGGDGSCQVEMEISTSSMQMVSEYVVCNRVWCGD